MKLKKQLKQQLFKYINITKVQIRISSRRQNKRKKDNLNVDVECNVPVDLPVFCWVEETRYGVASRKRI